MKPLEAFETETELRRDLGRATAIAVVIGTVVGSGIFIAPSLVLGRVGSPAMALLVWLVRASDRSRTQGDDRIFISAIG